MNRITSHSYRRKADLHQFCIGSKVIRHRVDVVQQSQNLDAMTTNFSSRKRDTSQRGLEVAKRECLTCDLDEIEDERPFLFVCPTYAKQRELLLQIANSPSLEYDYL